MERVKAIFDYVLELQPEQREVFLKKISTQDPEAHEQVRRMLDQTQADTQDIPSEPAECPAPGHKYIFAPGDLIGGRYRVVRAIAKGGMGEVYEVEDRELHSRVALKVISLKSAARPNTNEMFRREITLARQVTHPNVCRIFDLGHHDHPEHGDLLFLTMELLHGTTLSDYVHSKGTLTKEEALLLLQQMIHALSAAHKLNIAHRDFKSGNVILCGAASSTEGAAPSSGSSGSGARQSSGSSASPSSGSPAVAASGSSSAAPDANQTGAPGPSVGGLKNVVVKVTDFGLARSLDGMETTVHNEIWGTPDYMAPEQFRGQSSIASDIYALGVVIYEMFTGKLPHRSSTSPVQPDGKPGAAIEKIPSEWRPVVRKCMAYEPADRYATVEEVWAELNGERTEKDKGAFGLGRRTLAAIAVALVAVIGLTAWLERERIYRLFHPLPGPKHIAVLPFESIGGDADAKAFADGMGETLTSKLTQLGSEQPRYWVVPFSDSRKHSGIEDARRNLGVTLVITGSLQRTNDGLRITTNLVDAEKHRVLASRVMTASMLDLTQLQDQTWETVAAMVQVPVDGDTRGKLNAGSTLNSRAYQYYEQGMGYLQRGDPPSVDKAISALQKSAAEDPQYVFAMAGLGDAYAVKYALTKDPQWMRLATQYGNRASGMNPDLPPVHHTLGKIYQNSGKFDEALAEFRRTLELNPMAIDAAHRVAHIYALQGKTAEAEESYKQVISRMPSYWLGYSGLGEIYYTQGKFKDAAEQYQRMIECQPDNPMGYENLGGAYTQMGNYQEAIAVLQKGLAVQPSPELWSDLGAAYMFTGENAKAAEAMKKAVELNPHDHVLWRNLADSYRQVPSLAAQAPDAYRKALEASRQQLAINPKDKDALSGSALYEAHLGNQPEARDYISKAIKQAPGDSDVLFTAALVYEMIGERKAALNYLRESLKSGFSLEDVRREPELQALRSDRRYQELLSSQQAKAN